MYQLIYTSAPRLLEAGKSGFGTVARSRELPQPLVAYLERISSYDRAAGVSAHVFYSCFSMGALRYHAFSRVADSGVDYSKRTNHIVHHWIVLEDASTLDWMRLCTPAAVLMGLQRYWLSTWEGMPRWFDTPFQLNVPELVESRSWERFTGDNDNRYWLKSSETEGGITLLLPQGADEQESLQLLHDALILRDDRGWGIGFTMAASSTLSRKVCPVVCHSAEQQTRKLAPTAGYTCIHIAPGLKPPAFALVSLPSIPVPTEMPPVVAPVPDTVMSAPMGVPQWSGTPAVPQSMPQPVPREVPTSKSKRNYPALMAVLACCLVGGGIMLYSSRDAAAQPGSESGGKGGQTAPELIPAQYAESASVPEPQTVSTPEPEPQNAAEYVSSEPVSVEPAKPETVHQPQITENVSPESVPEKPDKPETVHQPQITENVSPEPGPVAPADPETVHQTRVTENVSPESAPEESPTPDQIEFSVPLKEVADSVRVVNEKGEKVFTITVEAVKVRLNFIRRHIDEVHPGYDFSTVHQGKKEVLDESPAIIKEKRFSEPYSAELKKLQDNLENKKRVCDNLDKQIKKSRKKNHKQNNQQKQEKQPSVNELKKQLEAAKTECDNLTNEIKASIKATQKSLKERYLIETRIDFSCKRLIDGPFKRLELSGKINYTPQQPR